ncbi:hypothetical protein Ciccas_006960 [Cichlidogyrus casuarinus]|uniref:Uncharacterized protein n=1 Tax=Cichlidogyrus casuarinus TaxID=1844966 RepID=A0ABD2Q4D1_9PLAT
MNLFIGLLKENEVNTKQLNKEALDGIAELDSFIEMHNELSCHEATMSTVLDKTEQKLASNLSDGAQQLCETMRFVRQLQTELSNLEELALKLPLRQEEWSSDESEVSSTGGHQLNGTLSSAVHKVREIADLLAESQAKMAMFAEMESREEGDGRSEKAGPASLNLKDKLNELGMCGAVAKMTDSQMLDFSDDQISVAPVSLVSSASSGLFDGAPMAAEEDTFEEEPRKELILMRQQLDATKHDLATLQEALRLQKEENTLHKQTIERMRTSQETGTNLDSLKQDYRRMCEKMDQIEQDLSISKREHLSQMEQSRQLRKELEKTEAERNTLMERLEQLQKNEDKSSQPEESLRGQNSLVMNVSGPSPHSTH